MANKILLDYVFPITAIEPIPAASTLFLKQVCVVAKPKTGQEGNVGQVFECATMTAVTNRTDNTNSQQLFNAGLSKVFVLLADDLNLETPIAEHLSEFFTVLISDDFEDEDITAEGTPAVAASRVIGDLTFTAKTAGTAGNSLTVALVDEVDDAGEEVAHVTGNDITILMKDAASTAAQIKAAVDDSLAVSALISVEIALGEDATAQAADAGGALSGGSAGTGAGLQITAFKGVVGISTQDGAVASAQAAISNRSAFFSNITNKAKNMFFAFGSLLSNYVNWLNQQYISMPFDDGIDELGDANSFFDDKVSFVLSDAEFANRLALFAAGGKAIAAPYIIKNLEIDLQSRAVQWIASNQPTYTKKEAALLETRLQEDVINSYIARNWITEGTVSITLEQDNFVASGSIDVAEPKALWRVFSELRQTL